MISGVELEESNSVRAVVRIRGDIAGIPVAQRITLYEGLKKIDIENTLDWKPGRFMKIEQVFPLEQNGVEVRTGIPFGSASGKDVMPGSGPHFRDEVPNEIWKGWRQVQDWVFAGTSAWGFTVSADHQVFNVNEKDIRGSMLRGTRYNPLKVVRGGQEVLIQQPPPGSYTYRYSFTSGQGDWGAAKSWRAGLAFNTPLIPVTAVNELSKKALPPEQSFCSVESDQLVLSAIKKADRDDSIVLRLYDARGTSSRTPVRFLGAERSFRMANLLEERQGDADQKVLQIQPNEINTVMLSVR
jgi:alpha-mannosidase